MATIEAVDATRFKGLTFHQPLGQRTIVIGPNGSGKTARTQALTLALLGKVPGVAARNPDVLATFGIDNDLSVSVVIGGKVFTRRFTANSSGAVSQTYRVGNRTAKAPDFEAALRQAGAPRLLDLGAFMSLSDAKKAEEVMTLFPPKGDLAALDDAVAELREKVNALARDERDLRSVAEATRQRKAAIQLPSGTLAEVRDRIATREAELKQANDDRARVIQEAAVQQAKEEAEARAAREKAQAQANLLLSQPAQKDPVESETFMTSWGEAHIERQGQSAARTGSVLQEFPPMAGEEDYPHCLNSTVTESIQRIINAMDAAGCSACTARLVAKRELRKYLPVKTGEEAA